MAYGLLGAPERRCEICKAQVHRLGGGPGAPRGKGPGRPGPTRRSRRTAWGSAGPRVQGARVANPGPRGGCRPSGKALCPPEGPRFGLKLGLLGKGTGLVPLYSSRANPPVRQGKGSNRLP